jgi:predicted type IV restriction endonuclease/energy-coupling factor transporter ATP-binding protein EcfA2
VAGNTKKEYKMTSDEGFAELKKICEVYKEEKNYSEADTRCKIIDDIFINVLGWSESFIIRESHSESGYADYQFRDNDVLYFITEAKKFGEYFEIPTSMANRYYNINGAISGVKNLQDAIKQARSYADDNGCKYAVITNGKQFGIFASITVGKPWREGKIILFHSINDLIDNFSLFWNILAFENVKNGSLHKNIEEHKADIVHLKTINEMRELNSSYTRNYLYTYLRPLTQLIFSELLDEAQSEILKKCYVYGRSNNTLYQDLEDYFIDKVPRNISEMNVKDIIENEKKAGVFQDLFIDFMRQKKGAIILLLGGIGSGKSTFLHRFFRIVMANDINVITFNIDFRKSPPNKDKVEDYILNQMCDIWKDIFAPKYYKHLRDNGFDVEICPEKEQIKRIFSFLKTSKTICLVIDNVDQHTKEYQENLFSEACYLSDYFGILTIVSLREETYLSSSRLGIFDAYAIPKFHIASPNFLSMIKKRLEYAIEFVTKIKPENDKRMSLKIKSDLINYFHIILGSLKKDNVQSKKLIELIDSITVGNMREGLEFFNNFLYSGNTNIDEIFAIYRSTGRYQISYHQFVKSIMLGEYRYYQQDKSKIYNIFDFDYTITSSPFLSYKILSFLNENADRKSEIGRGYVKLSIMYTEGNKIFIEENSIKDTLLKMAEYGMIELDTQAKDSLENASFCKITHSGRYYLSTMIFELVYLNNIMIDTPISDRELVYKIRSNIDEKGFPVIRERVDGFIEYLINEERKEKQQYPEYIDNSLGRFFIEDDLIRRTKNSREKK